MTGLCARTLVGNFISDCLGGDWGKKIFGLRGNIRIVGARERWGAHETRNMRRETRNGEGQECSGIGWRVGEAYFAGYSMRLPAFTRFWRGVARCEPWRSMGVACVSLRAAKRIGGWWYIERHGE